MIQHRFVVVGAFQALNAAEARHAFGLDDEQCELVFLVPPQARAADEARVMIELTGWRRVREIGPANTSLLPWMRKVRNARGLVDESASLDHLFVGDYQTQLARHAAHGVHDGDVVVLDDGLGTLRVNAHRVALAEGRPAPRLHPQVRPSREAVQHVVARLLGLRVGELERVTFFTIYDLTPAPPDRVVRNRYEWLRAQFPSPEVVDGTLFLGSPLVESGIVTADVYRTMLTRLREVAGPKLWYRPHPREHRDRVAALVAGVGMELLELDTVVEHGLLAGGWVPANVAANHSTTLDTLRVLLGDTVSVRSVPVPVELVPRRWREFITMAYADLDARLGEPVERLELL